MFCIEVPELNLKMKGLAESLIFTYRYPKLFGGDDILKADLLRYSMQIAMLRQQLTLSLISEQEFILIKNRIMWDYGMYSDLTSE